MTIVESVAAQDLAAAVRTSRSWRGVLRALGLDDVREIDYFAVVNGDLSVYLIPSAVVGGRLGISLRRYHRYLVAAGPLGQWSTDVGLTGFEPATP